MVYRRVVRPLLFALPPEWVHHASLTAMTHTPLSALIEPFARRDFPLLERKLFGLTFPNRHDLSRAIRARASFAFPPNRA